MPVRATAPFIEELPRLLRERGMSVRALAAAVGVHPSHLSRVLRRKDYKTASVPLMEEISRSLGLPRDYFAEVREAAVIHAVRTDGNLRDRFYDEIASGKGGS